MNRTNNANLRNNENRHPTTSLAADWLSTGTCTVGLFHQDSTNSVNLCAKCFARTIRERRPNYDTILQHTLRIGFTLSLETCDHCSQPLEEIRSCTNCEACREVQIDFIKFIFHYGDTPYYSHKPLAIPISHRRFKPRSV